MRRYFFFGIGIIIDLALFLSHRMANIEVATAEYIAILLLGAFIDNTAHLFKSSEDLRERVGLLEKAIKAEEAALEHLRGDVVESNRTTLRELEERAEQMVKNLGEFQSALRGLNSQLTERIDKLGDSNATAVEGLRRLRDTLRDGDSVRRIVLDVRENFADLESHLDRLLARMKDMATRGRVVVDRRSDVYAEDRRLIDKLGINQELGSCCFVQDDPGRQLIEDHDFTKFIQSQVMASYRGVQVRRAYVCETENDSRGPEFLKHLRDLESRIDTDGERRNFEVRVLVLEVVDRHMRAEYRVDVLVFGDDRVSEGDLNQLSQTLLRAEYRSDEHSIREAKRKFYRVFDRAVPLAEFLPRAGVKAAAS